MHHWILATFLLEFILQPPPVPRLFAISSVPMVSWNIHPTRTSSRLHMLCWVCWRFALESIWLVLLLIAGFLHSLSDLSSRPSLRTRAVFSTWSKKLLMFLTTSPPTLFTPLLFTVDFYVLWFLPNGTFHHQIRALMEKEMRSLSFLWTGDKATTLLKAIYKRPTVMASSSRTTVKSLRISSTNFSLTVRWDRLRTYLHSHQLWHLIRRKIIWAYLP